MPTKEEKKLLKEEKNLQKSRRLRAKEEKKPAKRARQQTDKEGSRSKAVAQAQKVRQNFLDLPPALWPLVLIVAYIWARNTWIKERQERDIREARRFLKERNGLRVEQQRSKGH